MESLATESVDRTGLVGPVLRETDPDDFLRNPDDFLRDDVRVRVDTDVVDSVVVASVSTVAAGARVAVEEAVAVLAPDFSGREHAAANTTAEKTPASESPVIYQFPE